MIWILTFAWIATSIANGFQLQCFDCNWFHVETEGSDRDIAQRLRDQSHHKCLRPEDDAPRQNCPLPVAGYLNKCLLINGTVRAETPTGEIMYRAKMRRCIAVPEGDVIYDSTCKTNPMIFGQISDIMRVVPNLGYFRLDGRLCFCHQKNCNEAARQQPPPLTLFLAIALTSYSLLVT